MNLFDPAHLENQVTWTGLSFLALLFVMWKYVVPAVNSVLDERAGKIKEDLDGAEKMRADAEKTLAEYQKQLAAARSEAANIVAEARASAEAVVANRTAELEHELSRKMAAAEARIEQAQQKAMQELQTQFADMVVMATEKVVGDAVDAKKAEKIASDSLKNMVN